MGFANALLSQGADSVKVSTLGSKDTSTVSMTATRRFPGVNKPAQFFPAGYEEKTDSPEWDEVLAHLAAEIKGRPHCVPVRTVKEPKSPLDF